MKATVQEKLLSGTWPPNRRLLLLIGAAMVFPTRSYFIQEIRFWLVVLAVLVSLGLLLFATFIVLREAGHRGHHWMQMHVGKSTAPKHGRLILQNTIRGQLPRH